MEEGLNIYSIKDLENFSGIKAHTIRIWEKRYSILEPDRTESNIRMYSESELKKILNVAFLNRNGLKISKIAILDDDQLTGKVMDVSSRNDDNDKEFQPGKLLMSALKYDEQNFTEALKPFIKNHGVESAYIRFFHPLLVKASILWQTGSLSRAQEQFVRHCIRQVILTGDSELRLSPSANPVTVAMISTSENLSENNFLFYKYALKRRGFNVVFTGGILPASEVFEIYKVKPFRFLVVNSGSFDYTGKKFEYFNNAGKQLALKKIIFTDYPGTPEKKIPERIILSGDPADFLVKISQLG